MKYPEARAFLAEVVQFVLAEFGTEGSVAGSA